jgi:hypothetical protein
MTSATTFNPNNCAHEQLFKASGLVEANMATTVTKDNICASGKEGIKGNDQTDKRTSLCKPEDLFLALAHIENKLDLNNDVLDKNNDCLTIPICINIKDEEVEISKTLDKNSIIKIISKYNKDLSSQINKMNICKIEHPKTKNAYKSSIAQ